MLSVVFNNQLERPVNISGQLEPPLQEGAEQGGEDRGP